MRSLSTMFAAAIGFTLVYYPVPSQAFEFNYKNKKTFGDGVLAKRVSQIRLKSTKQELWVFGTAVGTAFGTAIGGVLVGGGLIQN
jgi:hypothetical protein